MYELDSHDIISTEQNGLRTVTRSLILAAGTDYDKVVGTDTITHSIDPTDSAVTLYLAGFSIRDTSEFRVITEEYLEAGTINRSIQTSNNGSLITERVESRFDDPVAETAGAVKITEQEANIGGYPAKVFTFVKGDGQIQVKTEGGPNSIPNSKIVTVVSYGSAAIVPDGILIDSQDEEEDGYKRFIRSCIQNTGTGDIDDITGIKYDYEDVEEVTIPGVVTLTTESVSLEGITGTIAVPKLEPIRQKQIPVKVEYEIVNSVDYPSTPTERAYDLGQISCSVTTTKASLKTGSGGSATVTSGSTSTTSSGYTQSFTGSARIQTYPSCYINTTGGFTTSATGNIDYTGASIPRASGNIISFDTYGASTQTKVIGEGSTAANGYSTTGLLSVDVDVVLVAVDGSIFYGVTKITAV